MTTVLLSERSGTEEMIPIPRRARLADRLTARLAARRLDIALARGASPDHNAALSLRAHALIGARCRAHLARCCRELLRRAEEPWQPMFNPFPTPARARVLACRAELEALADALTAAAAVDAGGVAAGLLLLSDGTGPLYGECYGVDELRSALLCILDALAPARP